MIYLKFCRRLTKMSKSIIDVKKNLDDINNRIRQSFLRRQPNITTGPPCLVAVSKTKPIELIIEAYEHGQRDFGENYVQELCDKAADPQIEQHCPNIKWHFIGHVQSNKINKLLSVQKLHMIQTVDSKKLAENLNNALLKQKKKLNVLIQVNTSAEAEKHGLSPDESYETFNYVVEKCENLIVQGIMTIGAFGYDISKGPNPDFVNLMEIYKRLYSENKNLIVSMGMSDDFEHAIELGSSMIRVGSSIFGERQYNKS